MPRQPHPAILLALKPSIPTQHYIRGTVSPTTGSSATVYYATTTGGPYQTVTAASNGTYQIPVDDNSGPYYIKASKLGYITSAEYSPAPSLGTSDVTGINFTLAGLPPATLANSFITELEHTFGEISGNDQIVTGWGPGTGGSDPNWDVFNFQKWNDFTNELYGELVDRYGNNMTGLYLDEGSTAGDSYRVVDYTRLRQTIESRNPHLIMIQNYYGNLYTCDIGDIEYCHWGAFGSTDGSTWPAHTKPVGTCFASNWWATTPAGTNTVWYTAENMFRYTVLQAGANTDGGGVQWATGPYAGGGWETGVDTTMRQVGTYIKAIAPSIKGVYASQAYTTPQGATDAVDGSATFLHVLKAPTGRTLTIGKAANGVVFTGATMLISGKECGFTSNASGYVVTLPADETWDSLDTVIRLQCVPH